jgi:hypothetical protein
MPFGSAMDHDRFTNHAAAFLLVTACVLSALLIRAPGTGDVGMFLIWGALGQEHGLVEGYRVMVERWSDTILGGMRSAGGGESPPLGFVWLYAVCEAADLIGVSHFLALKSALFVFSLASTGMIWLFSRSIALAAGFQGATILSAAGLGYTDVVFAPFLIGALWAIRDDRPVLGFILFLLSILLKWQPLIIAPFLVLYMLKISDLRSMGRALVKPLTWKLGIILLVVVLCISAVFGDLPLRAFLLAFHHPYLSGNALNMPWVATFLLHLVGSPQSAFTDTVDYVMLPPIRLLPFRLIFFVLFVFILLRFVRTERNFANFLLFSVLGTVTYGVWNSAVHENHWFIALVPAFVLAGEADTHTNRWIAILIAVMLNVNLFVFYGVTGDALIVRTVSIDLSVILALLYGVIWFSLFFLVFSIRPSSEALLDDQR